MASFPAWKQHEPERLVECRGPIVLRVNDGSVGSNRRSGVQHPCDRIRNEKLSYVALPATYWNRAASSYATLTGAWSPVVAKDNVPACTYCSDTNPQNVTDKERSYWSTHLVAPGIEPGRVQSTTRTLTAPRPALSVKIQRNSVLVPVSQHFGLRSVATITQ